MKCIIFSLNGLQIGGCHGRTGNWCVVGERIVLGEGTLFYYEKGVGLRPEDGRDELWLDIHALYRAHNQTVTLIFEESI